MTKIGEGMARWFGLPLLMLLLATAPAFGLVSVQSSVDRDRVGVGDEVVYTLTVLSDGVVDVQSPRPPDLEGFQVLDTWDATAVSQRLAPGPRGMEFQTQRRREFNYRLKATKTGPWTIGAFEVTVDGKKHDTAPITLTVGAEPTGPAQGQAQGGSTWPFPDQDALDSIDRADEELFNQLLQRRAQQAPPRPEPQHRTLPVNPNEAFFVQVEVDKTEVYEGEQVTVSWYIYTRGQMETLDRVKFPDLRGFWKEVIEEVPTIQFTEEIVNGVPYRKALLASHALFPIKTGTAVIDEYKIKSRLRLPTPGMGGFSFGRPYEFTKSSQRVNIKVKPLPTEGRPASFTGAVGTFNAHAAVDSATAPAHQPFNFRVRFEGSGNAKGIELPAIDWPKTVEVYDTKSESRFFKNGRSYKEFSILLIPRQEGELVIPPIEVSMFNPATAKYETKRTEEVRLQVIPGSIMPATTPLAGTAPPAIKPPPKADSLPEPVLAFRASGPVTAFFNRPLVWAGLYLAVFLALVFKARFELGGGPRRRDLREILSRRFKVLDKTVKTGDPRRIGTEMANLFSLVLGDIAGEAGASEEVAKVLERVPPSLRREFGEEILRRHEVFQVLAFAPEEALGGLRSPERMGREVSEAKSLLSRIVKRAMEDDHEIV